MKRVWLVAAENGVFPGGKVGGVGDVVRDLPIALAATGLDMRVITPSYGMFHKLPGATLYRKVKTRFARRQYVARVYRVPVADSPVGHFVIEHRRFSPNGPGQIYIRDEPGKPYAADAAKFAFFNAVVAAWVNCSDAPPEVLHLNDWHTGLVPVLRQFDQPQSSLKRVRIVFSIHNLAYQGIRPLKGDKSSLESWFPRLVRHHSCMQDPRYDDCINFMVSAIRLADSINTVSPSYAMEIQRPSDPSTGFSGGEGLEIELARAWSGGRLVGILNGCMYPEKAAPALEWDELLQLLARYPDIINARQAASAWIKRRKGKRPRNLLLSIGRVADQKVPLFLEPVSGHESALEAIMTGLGPDSLFIMLGSGDKKLEERLVRIARSLDNFLYLRGYVESLSDPFYASSDLFLMPSSFEPCGISQMLSMRYGVPCVVHAVGGLKDTVNDGITGFMFDGESPGKQAENFVAAVLNAIRIRREDPAKWQEICSNASDQRFSWDLAAAEYRQRLYQNES